jgi:hypothetical protein
VGIVGDMCHKFRDIQQFDHGSCENTTGCITNRRLAENNGQAHLWQCISTMRESLEIQMGAGKPKFENNVTMVLRPYGHSVDLSRCTLVVGESSVLTMEGM